MCGLGDTNQSTCCLLFVRFPYGLSRARTHRILTIFLYMLKAEIINHLLRGRGEVPELARFAQLLSVCTKTKAQSSRVQIYAFPHTPSLPNTYHPQQILRVCAMVHLRTEWTFNRKRQLKKHSSTCKNSNRNDRLHVFSFLLV